MSVEHRPGKSGPVLVCRKDANGSLLSTLGIEPATVSED